MHMSWSCGGAARSQSLGGPMVVRFNAVFVSESGRSISSAAKREVRAGRGQRTAGRGKAFVSARLAIADPLSPSRIQGHFMPRDPHRRWDIFLVGGSNPSQAGTRTAKRYCIVVRHWLRR